MALQMTEEGGKILRQAVWSASPLLAEEYKLLV